MGKFIQIVSLLLSVLMATGLAMGGATWQAQPYHLTVPVHVTSVGAAVSGSMLLTLDHDVACTLTVSAGGGDEVLSQNGQSLATYYKLTGTALGDGDPAGDQPNDAGWVDSATFIARQYHTSGLSPQVILCVKGVAPADHALKAGKYTANIILTAAW